MQSSWPPHCQFERTRANWKTLASSIEVLRLASFSSTAVKIDGRQHYRVAYGSYASPAEALGAIKGLPPQLPRTIRTIEAWKECAARIASSAAGNTRAP